MSDAVAIVGMAGRFPGASDVAAFWRMLREGREALTHFTDDDLLAAGVGRRWLADPAYVRAGMVLDDIESFDADFFGIPDAEAEMMDPQQRLLLECGWEALEDAGVVAGNGLRVAVYAGARMSEYMLFRQQPPDLFGHSNDAPIDGFRRLLVNDKDYLATRLAYLLDLRGPAVTVQTACSTSLVAVHMACQSLLNGECEVAMAGGASVRVPQRAGYVFGEGMIYSPDGHTRPFDANGRGTVFGSGVGVVVLKRLDDAVADGDRIHAVIRASAVNNDGAASKAAFTAPSLDGQVRVIAEALAVGGIDPASVSYVETHGTGTAVGDPIEVAALAEAFGGPRSFRCAIGSVKSNIGHLVQAAGVAGLIKTALMLRHRELVPSVNFDAPNPLIDFERTPFFVNTLTTAWEGEVLRAGVSAFGFGGTNAHVVLEEPPRRERVSAGSGPYVLPISAKSPAALEALRASYSESMEDAESFCATAQSGRAHFPHRLAVSGASADELRERLQRAAPSHAPQTPRIGFVFTGQGSQYEGMARELYEHEPLFRATFDACDAAIAGADVSRTECAQPAIVALEIALATLLRERGLVPSVVLGHSLGELAAAHAAGILTLEDAMRFARARGRLMESTAPGAMLSVFAPAERLASYAIAAINSEQQTVITGDEEAIARAANEFPSRRLAGTYAFHSAAMDPILDALEAEAATLRHDDPRCAFVSTLTGALAQRLDARYWRDQARQPVRFADALATARGQCDVLVEIGPDAILSTLAGDIIPTLRRGGRDRERISEVIAELYARGASIRWERRPFAEIPTYAFQRRRFWIEKRTVTEPLPPDVHPLLGRRIPSPLRDVQYHARLDASLAPYTRDHWVYGARPLVGVAQLEMIRAAGEANVVENFVVEQPLLLDETPRQVQTILSDDVVRIYSRAGDDAPWEQHASGRVKSAPVAGETLDIAAIQARCPELVAGESIRAAKRARGADIGPAFDIVRVAWRGRGEALVDVILHDDDARFDHYLAYPGVLDAAAQCADLTLDAPDPAHLFLPTVVERAVFHARTPRRVWTYLKRRDDAAGEVYGVDVRVADEHGRVLVSIDGFFFKRATPASLRRAGGEPAYEVQWVRVDAQPPGEKRGTWYSGDCAGALALVQSLDEGPLTFVTRRAQATGRETAPLDPEQAMLWGFARVVRREQPALRVRVIDTDGDGVVLASDDEDELVIRGGVAYAPRLRPLQSAPKKTPYRIVAGAERTIESLRTETLERREPAAGEIEIEVIATGLNFRDTFNATGRLDGPLGYECSGIVSKGNASLAEGTPVMALARNSLASHVIVDARFAVPKPRNLNFTAAAGVPVVFLTAAWGLVECAQLKAGERVLIHTAAGGVGQAAIQIAQMIGAEVIATASRGKWDAVRALGVERVFDSRAHGFGRGLEVDVVVNTLGSDFAEENFSVLRRGGRLIELGHANVIDLPRMQQLAAERGVALIHFHTADAGAEQPERMQRLFVQLAAWLESGELRPVAHRAFAPAQIGEALETILRGAHAAKLVVRHRRDERELALRDDATYLITGGTGALGLQLAQWLASRGARHIALMSRSAKSVPEIAGANMRVIAADVATATLDDIEPPLAGVIHAAGTIDDGVLAQLTWPRFAAVLAPKVEGAKNLHARTASMPLDFFVLVSSVSGVWGNAGQASYAAANAYLDQLAHARRQQGLPATVIDYGVWRGAGMGALLSDDARRRRAQNGLSDLEPEAALRALEAALRDDVPQVVVPGVDWTRYVKQFATLPSLFRDVAPRAIETRVETAVTNVPRTEQELIEVIRTHVAALARGPVGDGDLETPLPQLGLDSLAVLLLRGRLIAAIGATASLPVIRFLEGHGIAALARMMLAQQPVPTLAEVTKRFSLVTMKAEGTRTPLVIIPPAAHTVMLHSALAEEFDAERPLYGVNPVGFDDGMTPHETIEEMAAHYASEIRAAFPGKRVLVGGVCFGAQVALELAMQLRADGFTVPAVVAIDYHAPWPKPGQRSLWTIAGFWARRVGHHLRQWRLSAAVVRELRRRIQERRVDAVTGAAMLTVTHANARASRRYRAPVYDGSVVLVLSETYSGSRGEDRWRLVVDGPMSTVRVPGVTHTQLVGPDGAAVLARALRDSLRAFD